MQKLLKSSQLWRVATRSSIAHFSQMAQLSPGSYPSQTGVLYILYFINLDQSSLQSTVFLSLQQNNNIVFSNIKKEEGRPLLLEFPLFTKTQHDEEPNQLHQTIQPSQPETKKVAKSKVKREYDKEISKKGLRQISEQVKQLICQKKGLTYSEVADFVIEDSRAMMLPQQLQQPAAINIKRRVYDVLSVLTSLKLLEKDSKKRIFPTTQCYKIGIGTCKNRQQLQRITSSISVLKDQIKQKEAILRKTVDEYKKLKALTERNISYIERENALREKQIDRFLGDVDEFGQQSFETDSSNRIYFPFFYKIFKQKDKIDIEAIDFQKILTSRKKDSIGMEGHIDLVMKLQLPPCSKDETVEEIQQFLKQGYVRPNK